MAIIKDFITPQGVVAKYHKIVKAELLIVEQVLEVVVAVYASEEARINGKSVLWHEYVRVPFSVLQEDPRDHLYPILEAYVDSYLRKDTYVLETSASDLNLELSHTSVQTNAVESPVDTLIEGNINA